jgi:hypothetical protein
MSIRSANSRKLLLASTSALSFLISGSVLAQQAPAPSGDIQEVVVSGFRASQQKALDNKRDSDLPIESVAPEDIGKMPDQNVAESLQRLPGVQIDRSQGVGTSVLIDGLRQNLTTLNGDVFLTGKEFYVSGEGSGGGAGGGAQYGSLEGIPSEEIGGIDVYKNPKASITEGGLGGTIDLKTRDPLKQPVGWTLGGNFRMTMDEGQNDWTPIGTLVGSYNFNNKVAVTASFSYDHEKTQTSEFQDANRNQWAVSNYGTVPTAGQPLSAANYVTLPGSYIEPQLAYFSDIDDDRTTIGSSLGIAAKLTDSITTHLNWFYSREDDTSLTYSDKAWFNGSGTSAPYSATNLPSPGINSSLPYSIDGNGVVQSGTFVATGAETATLYQNNVSEANNLQWVTAYDAGGALRGSLDASYAYATSNLQAACRSGLQQRRLDLPGYRQCSLPVPVDQWRHVGPADGQISQRRAEQPGLHHLQVELGLGQPDLAAELRHQGRRPVRSDLRKEYRHHPVVGLPLWQPRRRPDLRPLSDQRHGSQWPGGRQCRQRRRVGPVAVLSGSRLWHAEHPLLDRHLQSEPRQDGQYHRCRQCHRQEPDHQRYHQSLDLSEFGLERRRGSQQQRSLLRRRPVLLQCPREDLCRLRDGRSRQRCEPLPSQCRRPLRPYRPDHQ